MKEPSQSLHAYKLTPLTFGGGLSTIFSEFSNPEFADLSERKKFHQINLALLNLILNSPKESFLLSPIIDYIEQIKHKGLLKQNYNLSYFEFWLNNYSELSSDKNYEVRAKIVGKHLPRDDYQAFFPIGMDKTFSGTHFVAAHISPDVDTMVASFWGWIDAFAARVGSARHIWSLPDGPPDSPVTHVFRESLGSSIFTNTASMVPNLSLAAFDLISQQNFLKKTGDISISSLDLNTSEKAIILVDEEGYYIGDWHHRDIEPVRKIIIRFKSCLRWFENNLHVKLISFFAKPDLHINDLPEFVASLFDISIQDCEPAREFTERQKKDLNDFFKKVLGVENGLAGTFRELNQALAKLSVYHLIRFEEEVQSLKTSDLFSASGKIREDRPTIFNRLLKMINQLDSAIQQVRDYVERLDVAIHIKNKVFGLPNQFITLRYDIDDIRIKMDSREYLTVVIQDRDNKLFPIGVVWAHTINKTTLGTVTFRDFCNQDEVRMAPYLSPISVVDHHKMTLKTNSPPLAIIGDVQSCNVLVAEQTFRLNDRFAVNGMSVAEIEKQIEQLKQAPQSMANTRILRRLLQRREAAESAGKYFVHSKRELTEYFCFLHAILDDTDLLTKVCKRDVECVVELLNRMNSLLVKKEVEVVNLDNIPQDHHFAKEAAKRILRNRDMYAFYRQIYDTKEREIEESLALGLQNKFDALFADTKEQNGCCRVGQTKLFSSNFPSFLKIAPKMMEFWVNNATDTHRKKPQIDLHLHMVSTIASAEEVYEDKVGHYTHQDQLWFWNPTTQKGYDHLTTFLTAFFSAMKFDSGTQIKFLPGVSEEVQRIFMQNAFEITCERQLEGPNLPVAILYFAAGTINSRKAMITPYLPKI